jgi:hypothetical protein
VFELIGKTALIFARFMKSISLIQIDTDRDRSIHDGRSDDTFTPLVRSAVKAVRGYHNYV